VLRNEVFDAGYASAFGRSRSVPLALRAFYLWDIFRRMPHPEIHLLDVGAGTGQFYAALRALPEFDEVSATLLEPSDEMRAGLNPAVLRSGDEWNQSRLEDARIPVTCNAALMSEVVHLVGGPDEAMRALSAAASGIYCVGVRAGTREQVLGRDWYAYFPEAHTIDIDCQPPARDYVVAMESVGYRATSVEMDESRFMNPDEYIAHFSTRPFSSLRLISDDAFEVGIAHLRRSLSGLSRVHYDCRMQWTVGVRSDG
jgi:hypothetical protein